ncbi:MAG: Fe-S cluster assembly ATPase SufC [Firmicutes bacterium]|nr:Fe-S cluster assembly ATPase SufC [Bacillota bacterium]
MATPVLEIRDLHVSIGEKEIIQGVHLTIRGGEVHAIMGPNGAGKSTLAAALMGHPAYTVTSGEVLLDGEDLLQMPVDERARQGLFLAMQYPAEIPGVSLGNFLRAAVNARMGEEQGLSIMAFHRKLMETMKSLGIDPSFAERYVNEGFSGGEKKRSEMLQMTMLTPRIAMLDEIDSGLDVDALRAVAQDINRLRGPELGLMIITHYERILQYVEPDFVHILIDGRLVRSGGKDLVAQIEEKGYDWLRAEAGLPAGTAE